MLHMEEVRRVVRAEVMFHIRQQTRCFIAGRLYDLTVQTRQRLLHERMPCVLIAGWSCLLQEDVVALGLYCYQAKPPGKRFILGQRDGFSGHVFGQTRAFLPAVRHDGLLHVPVDLLLRPIGDRNKAIKACEFQEEANQANTTGTDFGTHQVYPEHQTMQEGKTRGTVKKSHDGGMLVEALLIGPPCLQRAAGHM
jgi:hypothetical protein